ncbi:MAG: hypothetical protein V9E89_16925 [Ilumatobacteraceae bacterium]
MKLATDNCANVTCVLSKIDNYVDWRLIRDLDTRHLQRAGLDVPIVPVSALLHLTAARRARLEYDEESGIADLVRLVSTSIADEVERQQVAESAIDIEGTIAQLRGVLLSETGALDPQRHAEVVAELKSALRNVAGLRLDSAGWHRFLRDGVDDLRVSTLDELEAQMRDLTTEAESVIAANDPTTIWDEFQSWLRARATKSVSDIYVAVANDVKTLEERLLEQLAHAEAEALAFESGLSSPFMGSLRLDIVDSAFEDRATNVLIEKLVERRRTATRRRRVHPRSGPGQPGRRRGGRVGVRPASPARAQGQGPGGPARAGPGAPARVRRGGAAAGGPQRRALQQPPVSRDP